MNFSDYHLIYNAAAHFEAAAKYPDGIMEALSQSGMEGFAATCWALELLSTQGELVRRDMGHDRQEPINAKKAMLHMKPREALEARRLIVEAITRGLRASGEEDEVDEVLAEIQKKTETG